MKGIFKDISDKISNRIVNAISEIEKVAHDLNVPFFVFSIKLRIRKDPQLDIRIPIIPGLAVLKIISWENRYPDRSSKDADDLLFIMTKYDFSSNQDRLFGVESDLMERENHDLRLAGIRLLGKDMAKICDKETSEKN